ncbi:MAG TPA: MBL fold metallo-hydrolase [Syntrophales bacterium]|jgi:glyoxylase-like metal-dependent hydrolase (beta-lactamase superfamily II)|nr:MBL fold metallo-hydrolase [Syntrophales bacterium]HON23954.1 MBL fold metallo-hydrolase [Syntrophales bacterium]HOU76996.1 MBL fold metallo-hydrolase [Syntrophales bacterium]HPC32276.1 MBL fold metallo-hydrolase [Syntrophales bacterium]HQG34018.1 MBL fold metallo-hydrolase [Syntrophales bacterium]
MIVESRGRLHEFIYAIGAAELPGYLVTAGIPTLFDAGITFMGPLYLAELKEILTDHHRLSYHFLTHSHFDHAGASPYLRRRIPGLKIGAAAAAADTFRKPQAVELIRSLSAGLEEKYRFLTGDEDIQFSGLEIDLVLTEGMRITLGKGLSCQVIATPGHTRDSLSFYLPEIKSLITGEAVGVFDRNFKIHPEFTSSYHDYLNSLNKLAALDIEILMMSHFFTLTGTDARDFLPHSLAETIAFKDRIEHYLNDSHGNRQAVAERIFKEDFEDTGAILQDARPYRINLEAKIRVIAENR